MSIRYVMHRNEKRNLAVGFTNDMESGQTLSSPVVSIWDKETDVSTSGFTISSVGINTTVLTDDKGNTVAIDQAVVFTVEGKDTLEHKDYQVRVEATLDQTSENIFGQDSAGDPPSILIGTWGEATP